MTAMCEIRECCRRGFSPSSHELEVRTGSRQVLFSGASWVSEADCKALSSDTGGPLAIPARRTCHRRSTLPFGFAYVLQPPGLLRRLAVSTARSLLGRVLSHIDSPNLSADLTFGPSRTAVSYMEPKTGGLWWVTHTLRRPKRSGDDFRQAAGIAASMPKGNSPVCTTSHVRALVSTCSKSRPA